MTDRTQAVLMAAFSVARRVGSGHVGVDHLLAALAGPPTPTHASEALHSIGVTEDGVRRLIGPDHTGEGPDPTSEGPDHEGVPQSATLTPAVYTLLGTARGLALAQGRPAGESHLLLALAYSDSGVVDAACHDLGVTRASIVASLAERGVDVPPDPPPAPPPPMAMEGVTFPVADLPAVLKALVREYPPGSAVRWGMNHVDDRGLILAESTEAIELVRATVADPSTIAPFTP